MKRLLWLLSATILIAVGTGPLSAQPMVIQEDVPAEAGFRAVPLVSGLEHPWGMAFLPDGDILITERPGRLRRVHDGRLAADAINGVPQVFAAGQGGLLDIALHPRFSDNRTVYFTYADGTFNANRTCVAAAEITGNMLRDWRVIFAVGVDKTGSQHFGSRLLWMPDGTLLVSIGDGGNPPIRLAGDWIRAQAQNRGAHLGKILRLNADGSVPDDNPLVGAGDAEPAVWSTGHRNIQGLAYDPIRDQVWASEHGALGGDELNVIRAGANYGWPLATYSREYVLGTKISDHTSRADMVDPVVVWMTAIAPSGLTVYTGGRFAAWQGDVLAGGLRSQDVRRIDLDPAGRVIGQFSLRIGERVRDVRQGPDGLIYVLTDESSGSLLRLEPAGDKKWPDAP